MKFVVRDKEFRKIQDIISKLHTQSEHTDDVDKNKLSQLVFDLDDVITDICLRNTGTEYYKPPEETEFGIWTRIIK